MVIERENYTISKKEAQRALNWLEEKEKPIGDALNYFVII